MITRVLITGANAGLGKETAKQLASNSEIEKIYLGCRNMEKALAAKLELEQLTGRSIFEVLIIDVSNQVSVIEAVQRLDCSVDALIMNAGGTGGKNFNKINSNGVTEIFAVNLLGHSLLAQELLKAGKLLKVAIYAGSEAARGVKEMGMKRPELPTSSEEEFASVCNGSFFKKTQDATVSYGSIKYMGALWMSAMARRYPHVKFITMSPGATTGTEGFNTLPLFKQYIMKSMMQVMLWFNKVHTVEIGAKRYLQGLYNNDLESGLFYASQKGLTGPLCDQSLLFPDLNSEQYQENAYNAIQRFL
ncbi:SDR family NAD(P)-dependent oxidoreductase [Pseudoalteromonas luteoviolacea]|uniref:SDR family NAD(P)-dependent oxidoreductase n=1 Tax=Pseudoalteromonas luteoviolacea TaxID=43657 RepID=UPI0011505913|nr:SDR family NAD(P)-dependent oxidoreductase [Pseudoalteromonas luteoviolacea]TQF67782.1 SDR family NAD(P)-dependent oxidoreductase [Pseudoalteromonas luteoviolacea]